MNSLLRMTLLAVAVIFMTLTSVQAGEVTLPHTFTAGTPAVAAQVNENFAAIEDAVNDTAADIAANTSTLAAQAADIADNAADIQAATSSLSSHRSSITTHEGHLARAYGYVNQYFLDQIHGSSNVSSVTWNATQSRYEITIQGLSVGPNNAVAVATPFSSSPRFTAVSSVDNKLLVHVFDIDGDPIQSSFHWVVFAY